MGNMGGDELLCDRKVSGSSDYMFSSIKIGDIVNMLPSDPFEMNISTSPTSSSSNSCCTMISGWIENDVDLDDTNGGLFFFGETSKKVLHSINERNASSCCIGDGNGDGDEEEEGRPPHDGLFFALGYLDVTDLLSVEGVCKSLRDGVRNDPLLWRDIHIDPPTGAELFTDECLLRITTRANGTLQSLSLNQCLYITDNGLYNVFQQNPGLTELSVLGCYRITMEGLLSNLKYLKTTVGNGIKRLRLGTLYFVTMKQYEELKEILSIDNNKKPLSNHKPRFYNCDQFISLDDDRPIDIEVCPKCHQLKQVYDCPEEKCARRRNYCRGCTFCIPRCIGCGCCFDERDYMETFCLDLLCLDCVTQILRFPDGVEEDISIHGFHQQASYHFYLYG